MAKQEKAGSDQLPKKDELTKTLMVEVLKAMLGADGNFTGERWQGVTAREFHILIDNSDRKRGGFMLRWQFRDVDSHLLQYREDFLSSEAARFLFRAHHMIAQARTATPRRNIMPEAKAPEDALRKLFKEKLDEHSRLEAKKDTGKPSRVDHDRELPQRGPEAVGEFDEPALVDEGPDLSKLRGFGHPRRSGQQ